MKLKELIRRFPYMLGVTALSTNLVLTPISAENTAANQTPAVEAQAEAEQAAQEAARKAAEQATREKAAQEKAAQEKAAQEKAAQEKAAQEKAAQEKAAQEKAAREKAAQEKAAQEKAAQEKAAQEKAAQEKAAQEKAAQEKAAQEKAAQEKAAQEAIDQKKAEQTEAESEPVEQIPGGEMPIHGYSSGGTGSSSASTPDSESSGASTVSSGTTESDASSDSTVSRTESTPESKPDSESSGASTSSGESTSQSVKNTSNTESSESFGKNKNKKDNQKNAKPDEKPNRKDGQSNIRSGGQSSPSVFIYGGSYQNYVSTDAQKRLSLNLGFTQIKKVFALAQRSKVRIRESRDGHAQEVGWLDKGGLCYILEDQGGPWVYVESGSVRGFVRRQELTTGKQVRRIVKQTGEEQFQLAEETVDPLQNGAYRYTLTTTRDLNSLMRSLSGTTVSRQAIVDFAMQFLGHPYVWGGDSLTNGTDCSGFTMQIYRHFGIDLPRCSYEQAEVGTKINPKDARPGDLLFYARNGQVYHVLMYIGDGKAINASSSRTGIIISNVRYDRVCWGVRLFEDVTSTDSATQATDLTAAGHDAYNGDRTAQSEIIAALAKAARTEWQTYGFCPSVLIAQAIDESGWCSFGSGTAGIQSVDNNILGMNADLLNSEWVSPWTGQAQNRLVPQYVNGQTVYGYEPMRTYESIEACMNDYAAFMIGRHPDLKGVTDVDLVIMEALKGYATNPSYQSDIRQIIDRFDLTRYDTPLAVDDAETQNGTEADKTAVAETESVTDSIDGSVEATPAVETPVQAETDPDDRTNSNTPAKLEGSESAAANTSNIATASAAAPNEAESGVSASSASGNAMSTASETQEADSIAASQDNSHMEGMFRKDNTSYSVAQMSQIEQIVAAYDTTYDGALAVISTAMNRADEDYGGYGTTAYAQLTAPGEFAADTDASQIVSWDVKRAVEDCLLHGVRNTDANVISSRSVDNASRIGTYWFYRTGEDMASSPGEANGTSETSGTETDETASGKLMQENAGQETNEEDEVVAAESVTDQE